MRGIWRLSAVLLCVLCVGLERPAHADTAYGCATEGGGSNDDCSALSPLPWRYFACDDAGSTAARQADWCFAFGGTGDATRCSADEHFTDANIAPVSANFEHIAHGCETPSMSDTGWGQTVNSFNCWTGGPTYDGGVLIEDHRTLNFNGHESVTACTRGFSEKVYAARYRDLTCPADYQRIRIDADHDFCVRTPSCPCHIVSNPTRVSDGQKIYWETDLAPVGGGLLQYKRVYRSGGRFTPWQAAGAIASDDFWESNFDSRLFVLDPTHNVVPYLVSAPEGTVRYFDAAGAEYLHYGRAAERLSVQRSGTGAITGYVRTLSDDSAETFAPDGRLTGYADTQGHTLTLAYDGAAHLSSVTDERGRTLRFDYNAAGQRSALTAPDGTRIAYAYGANANLQSVTYADGAVRSYRYENAAFPHALTGIGDENGADFAQYAYDSSGRVSDTRHAPELAGGAIEHFHFAYDTNATTITEPLGQNVTYTFALAGGVKNLASLSGPCGSCGEPFAAVQYDTAGYFSRSTDFNGNATTYAFNSRGLETSRTEAAGTSAQRTVTTVPDAQLRKPAQRTVSNASGDETRSAWQYNARGQTIAYCQLDPNDAAAAAYACSRDTAPPDGASVRRWTYRYCESADIAAGTCPLPGLLLSSDGPRADVKDETTYAYYDATDASGCGSVGGQCHARGDLKSVSNALGQVTTYVAYDALGHPARIKDANGVIVDFAYHARGWLTSRTVRANADGTPNGALDATTTIAYDAAGNITRVTQPDGTYLHYVYDAAHRLTDVYDSATPANYLLGDHIHYALDAAGNRTDEQTTDPNGTLKRELGRSYDQLNRLTAVLNSSHFAVQTFANPPETQAGSSAVDGYDANGNALYSIDGGAYRAGTEQQYDPLNRLIKTLQDHVGSSGTHDAKTQFAYDTRSHLRSVTDPDGLVTSYTYDALENLTDLSSPDTGHTAYGYDSAGNRRTQTDARGVATAYRYDALNRLTAIVYPTASLNVTYTYDQPASGCFNIGRLTQLTDSTGWTQYCYDRRGNVTKKTQSTLEPRSCSTMDTGCGSGFITAATTLATPYPTLTSAALLPVSYTYTLGDRVAAITYPSGAVVTYTRDGAGRVKSIVYQAPRSSGVAVLKNATYYPFGPANVLTFGNGRSLSKNYDADYAIASVLSSASDGLSIFARVDRLGNLIGAAATSSGALAQQYLYDPLFRLTTVEDAGGKSMLDLTYSPGGDRTTKAWGTNAQKYFYASFTHRAISIGNVARTYDANGNLLSGGLSYDDRNRLSGWNLVGGQINLMANSAQYDYNARGERVSKRTTQYTVCAPPTCNPLPGAPSGWLTGTEAFVYDESGLLLGEYPGPYGSGTATDYIYLDGVPVALARSGVVYYIETDQLGTPRQIVKPGSTSVDDSTVWKWDYLAANSAFGENAPSIQTLTFNLRFPGQYFDAETGLNYNYFRDYEPATGRYVESDPIGLSGGLSTYAYVGDNPIYSIDPSGLLQIFHPNRIYGYWCGPNWTGGYAKSWNELTPYEKAHVHPPKSPLDSSCRDHDVCYGNCGIDNLCDMTERSRCLQKCDRTLIDAAKHREFWGNVVALGIAAGKPYTHPEDATPPYDPKNCTCGGTK